MITSRLTRAQWGAVPVPASRPRRVESMRGVAVHWVGPAVWGSAGIGDHSKCAGKVQGIQRHHMAGEYYDIAYSEVVCPHGQRFEGRGHHVQVGANGSTYANARWYAILALVGTGDRITEEILHGISLAVRDYRRNAAAGTDVTGHRYLLQRYAGKVTACPGDALYRHVTRGTFGTVTLPTPTPSPTPTPTPGEIDMRQLVRLEGTDPVFVTDLINRRHVEDPKQLAVVQAELKAAGLRTTVKVVKDIDAYGVPVGPDPLQAGSGE